MKSFHFARIPRNPGHSVENFRPIVIKLVSYRRTIFKTKLSKNHLIVKVRYEFVLLHLLREHRWGREGVKRPRAGHAPSPLATSASASAVLRPSFQIPISPRIRIFRWPFLCPWGELQVPATTWPLPISLTHGPPSRSAPLASVAGSGGDPATQPEPPVDPWTGQCDLFCSRSGKWGWEPVRNAFSCRPPATGASIMWPGIRKAQRISW